MKHPKKRWLVPLLSVAVCAAVSLLAAWSDLTYNGGRLVYPMESYSFQRSDIPMLLALALDAFCALALLTFVLPAGGGDQPDPAAQSQAGVSGAVRLLRLSGLSARQRPEQLYALCLFRVFRILRLFL